MYPDMMYRQFKIFEICAQLAREYKLCTVHHQSYTSQPQIQAWK